MSGARGLRVPWLGLGVAALSWLCSSAPEAWQGRLALSHDAWRHAELWRLWTGHWVHFGPAHLRGDVLAFLVWAALLEQSSQRTFARIVLVAAPLLSLVLLLAYPRLTEYRGLSGLDCSLVVALILERGLGSARWRGAGLACLGLFFAKCGYELAFGRALLAPDLGQGVKLLPLAHVAGSALGWLIRPTAAPPVAQAECVPDS